MRSSAFIVALLTWALFLPQGALAGPVDSPVPTLNNQPTAAMYIVSGVTKNNSVETMVMCTSLEASGTAMVGVEIFDALGGPAFNNVAAGDGAQAVAAGGTVTIGTGNAAGFHEDEVIVGLPVNVKGGSARIVATTKRLTCGAYIMDDVGVPPTSMAQLPIIYRKQHGD